MTGDNVFPFGIGCGHSTESEIVCGLCGKVHNEGIDVDNGDAEGETVRSVAFGDIEVADCCFDKLEAIVLSGFCDISRWVKNQIDEYEARLREVRFASHNLERTVKKFENLKP